MKENVFHFTPKEQWMNDPNGLVFFQNEYHLFYQYHPHDIVWGPMHWGHAVSKDLLTWEHLPVALYPDELGTIYSGSCVVDHHDTSGFFEGKSGLVAMFTHHTEETEVQSIAYSKDKGRTWIKYAQNPVIHNPGQKDFRDPKVLWHAPTQKWIAIFAYKDRVRLYGSENLREWAYLSEFGQSDGSHEGVWECPDLFELAVDGNPQITKWVLKVDIGNAVAGGSGGQYYVGTFDGKHFVNDNSPDTILWLDYGKDFYAAQSWSEVYAQQGRNIWVAWMNNWQYANKIPADTTRGIFSVPRSFSLKSTPNGLRLAQSPIAELETLRKNIFTIADFQELTENIFPMPKNTFAAEIHTTISPLRAQEFSLRIRHGAHEVTLITYSHEAEQLSLDRSQSGNVAFHEDFPGKYVAPVSPVDGFVKLRVLLDRNTVEVFVHDGEICLSCLIFPSSSLTSIEIDDLMCIQNLSIFQLQK